MLLPYYAELAIFAMAKIDFFDKSQIEMTTHKHKI
jgi:hypothetical protein